VSLRTVKAAFGVGRFRRPRAAGAVAATGADAGEGDRGRDAIEHDFTDASYSAVRDYVARRRAAS